MQGYMKNWEDLTICDDYMFKLVMRRKRICRHMLERILQIKIRDIVYLDEEKTIDHSYGGKSIRLDVYVEDDNNTVFDIEMQIKNPGTTALTKRTRYYQTMMDLDMLKRGQPYDNLRASYIIFICPFDPFGKSRHIYTFYEWCDEDKSIEMGDETAKIFLNSLGTANDVPKDVKNFLNYINGVLSDDPFVQELDDTIRELKEEEEEKVGYMTFKMKMEEKFQEGMKEGLEKGLEKGKTSIIQSMLKNNIPLETIVAITGWSEDKIKNLAKE